MRSPFTMQASPQAVVAMLQQGRFAEALAASRVLVRDRPRDPAILQLAAIAAMQSGASADGVAWLKTAAAAAPADAGIAFNLAKALLDSGDHAGAGRIARQPDFAAHPDFARLRADAAKAGGDYPGARQAYEALLARDPNNGDLLNNLATTCLALADAPAAIRLLERALTVAPDSPVALTNLAKAHSQEGSSAAAIDAARRALDQAPRSVDAAVELGRALRLSGQQRDAIGQLARALETQGEHGALFAEIGHAFGELAEFDRAEDAYRRAIKAAPRTAQFYLPLGNLLEQSNRLGELDALIDSAQASGAEGPEIDFLTAHKLRRQGEFAAALALLGGPDPDEAVAPSQVAQLEGQLADRLGDVDRAYSAFSRMNRLVSQTPAAQGLSGGQYRDYVAGFRRAVTPAWYAAWPAAAPQDRPSPAFLVGFPRSGTTLLDTMLMGHERTHVLEEEPIMAAVHDAVGDLARIPELDQAEIERLRTLYFDEVAALGAYPSDSLIIDKLPLNLLRAPLIHRLFPDARFILALRHPCDAVLSCFMQNFRVNRAMASFWTIADAAKTYDAVFDFWENARSIMPLSVHTVRYEDLVADTAGELASLGTYLGLEPSDDMLDYQTTAAARKIVRTPSYEQITEPVYQRARGRWEKYRAHMAAALPVLSPWAERYGYGVAE
jgi:tetratricopeptide (TPR) repeat protein